MEYHQDNLDLFCDCQRSKSAPRMKNLRPIWTIRICSSSMILRKCRTEKPARPAALGISRNILLVVPDSCKFILSLLCQGYWHVGCHTQEGQSGLGKGER